MGVYMKSVNIPEIFGSKVFNDKAMRERLPKEAYEAVRRANEEGKPLTLDCAKIVADAMKACSDPKLSALAK